MSASWVNLHLKIRNQLIDTFVKKETLEEEEEEEEEISFDFDEIADLASIVFDIWLMPSFSDPAKNGGRRAFHAFDSAIFHARDYYLLISKP